MITEGFISYEQLENIPIIILHAGASVNSMIAGLDSEIDPHLTKLFNTKELQSKVREMLKNSKKLGKQDTQKPELDIDVSNTRNGYRSMDEQFINKAIEIVHENLSDSKFNAAVFSREMAMSRVHLYRKLKSITNKSISEFISCIRLQRASEMLKNRTDNITQIAYGVGFSHLSWFAKCFQKQFGMTPTDYAKLYWE